jgi:uncharacterized cupredoxin-like copper-binding protein
LKTLNASVWAALALCASGAFAHGDEVHAKNRRYDASMVEDTAFGREGDPKAVSRTVEIVAGDSMRFTPDRVTIERGQTIRFVVRNDGHLRHEMVLGTAETLREHAALMQRFPNMEHSEPHMSHVMPGDRGEIVWQFTRAGEFRFGCLQPGHYEAGMSGTVVVK